MEHAENLIRAYITGTAKDKQIVLSIIATGLEYIDELAEELGTENYPITQSDLKEFREKLKI